MSEDRDSYREAIEQLAAERRQRDERAARRGRLPAEILEQIGDMTVSFADLESEMKLFFAELLEDESKAIIMATYLPFKNLRAAIISLYMQRFDEDADFAVLRALMNRAGSIEERRNQITHSRWVGAQGAFEVMRIKMTARENKGFRAAIVMYTEAKLVEFVDEINTLTEDLRQLRTRFLNDPAKFGARLGEEH